MISNHVRLSMCNEDKTHLQFYVSAPDGASVHLLQTLMHNLVCQIARDKLNVTPEFNL